MNIPTIFWAIGWIVQHQFTHHLRQVGRPLCKKREISQTSFSVLVTSVELTEVSLV